MERLADEPEAAREIAAAPRGPAPEVPDLPNS
jgi:hypothetical protein